MKVEFIIFGTSTKYTVFVDSQETISESLEKASIEPKEGMKFIIMFNGKIIDPLFTFGSLNINEQSKIVILEKKCPQMRKHIHIISEEERECLLEEKLFDEQCRLADLGFSSWESDQKGNSIIQEIYNAEQQSQEEEDREIENFEHFLNATVVPQTTKMNDKPLPVCFILSD